MSHERKRKKLNSAHLFTFTQAVHTSLVILFTYLKPAKFTSVARKNYATVEIHLKLQIQVKRIKIKFL